MAWMQISNLAFDAKFSTLINLYFVALVRSVDDQAKEPMRTH